MGEYVKYKGESIKIGTCESLYYVTYPKYIAALNANLLSKLDSNSPPIEYAMPDSGFRFRFPFPDEDHLPFADIAKHDFDRGVPIKIDARYKSETGITDERLLQTTTLIKITQQKLVHRESDNKLCLALVYRETDNASYRIEDDKEIKDLLSQIIKHHISNEPDPVKKSFYRTIAIRILKGYRLEIQHNRLERRTRQRPNHLPPQDNTTIRRKR